jgi:hypothetical protein
MELQEQFEAAFAKTKTLQYKVSIMVKLEECIFKII